jgi:hypothetical protein
MAALRAWRLMPPCWRQRCFESGIEGIERDLPRGAPPLWVDVKQLVQFVRRNRERLAEYVNVLELEGPGDGASRVQAGWHCLLDTLDPSAYGTNVKLDGASGVLAAQERHSRQQDLSVRCPDAMMGATCQKAAS